MPHCNTGYHNSALGSTRCPSSPTPSVALGTSPYTESSKPGCADLQFATCIVLSCHLCSNACDHGDSEELKISTVYIGLSFQWLERQLVVGAAGILLALFGYPLRGQVTAPVQVYSYPPYESIPLRHIAVLL